MNDVLEKTDEKTITTTDDGDHDVFSHYVKKEKITEAHVLGIPVVAICGKVWVPHKDPEKYPVCPDCLKIYEQIKV